MKAEEGKRFGVADGQEVGIGLRPGEVATVGVVSRQTAKSIFVRQEGTIKEIQFDAHFGQERGAGGLGRKLVTDKTLIEAFKVRKEQERQDHDAKAEKRARIESYQLARKLDFAHLTTDEAARLWMRLGEGKLLQINKWLKEAGVI